MSKLLEQSRNKPDLIIKQGYLVKQGGSIKSWKKRWFKLFIRDSYAIVSYHKKKGDNPIDELNLKSASVGAVKDKDMIYVHPLNTDRTYYFKSDDKNTNLNEWMEALYNATRLVEVAIFSRHVVPYMDVLKILVNEFGGNKNQVMTILKRLGYSKKKDITKETFCNWFRWFSPLNLTVIESKTPKPTKQSSSSSLKVKESSVPLLPTETEDIKSLASVSRVNTLSYIHTLMNQSWFLSFADNNTVYSLLSDQSPGTFIVRYSVNHDRSYVLTYKLDGDGCDHKLILGNENGFYFPNGKAVFDNIYKAILGVSVEGLELKPFQDFNKKVSITFFGP